MMCLVLFRPFLVVIAIHHSPCYVFHILKPVYTIKYKLVFFKKKKNREKGGKNTPRSQITHLASFELLIVVTIQYSLCHLLMLLLDVFSDCHGLRVGYVQVWVRVQIPVPATYKTSPRTSKTDDN